MAHVTFSLFSCIPAYCGPCMSVAWQTGGESRYVAAGYAHGEAYRNE